MKVKKGNKIKVEYEGRFDDGTVFDSSKAHGNSLEFIAGIGQVVPGFDHAVIGMEKNQEKEFTLEPEEAYGERNEQLERAVPRNLLPKGQEPKTGMILLIGGSDGRQFPAKISKVSKESITVDLNHPLAGKRLTFKIKVIDIEEKGEGIENKI